MSGEGDAAGHVFISHSPRDALRASDLERALVAAGLRVWRPAASLRPGDDRQRKIRNTIENGTLAFLCCFSAGAAGKGECEWGELQLAIEEMRRRPPDEPWLIPVRFDDCEIPDVDLGGGRPMAGIWSADLFGPDAEAATGYLVDAVLRVLKAIAGQQDAQPDAAQRDDAPPGSSLSEAGVLAADDRRRLRLALCRAFPTREALDGLFVGSTPFGPALDDALTVEQAWITVVGRCASMPAADGYAQLISLVLGRYPYNEIFKEFQKRVRAVQRPADAGSAAAQ